MNKVSKRLLVYGKVFFILIISALFLMFLGSLIPNSLIQSNVTKSEPFAPSGEYINAMDFHVRGSILDKPTESVMLGSSLLNEDLSHLQSIMDVRNYARYWHGYLLVLRPLLVFTDITGIYYINMFVFYPLLAVFLYTIAQKLKPIYALFMVLALIPAHFYVIPCCMQYINIFLITFICSIIVLKKENIDLYLVMFITGCLTSFFDFLTAPLLTLLMPLTLYLLKEKKTPKESVLTVIKASLIWLLGYTCFWASKWLIGSIVLNRNVLQEASLSFNQRTGTFHLSRPMSVVGVLEVYFGFKTPLLVAAVVVELLTLPILGFKKKLTDCLWMLIIQIIPICWYFVTANHSLAHNFMTYRVVIVIAFIGLLIIYKAFNSPVASE